MEDSVSGHANRLDRHQAQRLLGVLADDFTGAADAALPFAERGLPTAVCLGVESVPAMQTQSQIVAIDLATRHMAAQEAATAVRWAVDSLRDAGICTLYKKIDSTLRGNLGAEIEAALCASAATMAVVCPAFPAMGRTVVGGRVQVRGVDLLQTAVRADVRSTIRSSRVADVLREQTSLPVRELIQSDATAIADWQGKYIVVAEAQSDDDLDVWVREVGVTPHVLWAGSAGLAAALSRTLPHTSRTAETRHDETRTDQALVVAGSAHPVTRRQIDTLLRSTDAVAVPVLPSEIFSDVMQSDETIDRAAAALRSSQSCVLYMERGIEDELAGCNGAEEEITRRLAAIAAQVQARAASCQTLVLTGGDTARAVLHEMGIACLVVTGAIAPGIPVLQPVGRDLRVVTKAGGFGDHDTLVRATR